MPIEIGAKIKQLRLQHSMTQEEVGTALGVSAQAVSKWESGATMPDIQLLPEVAVLFGISLDELFSLTDESKMDRIDNMLSHTRFMKENDFADAEHFLQEKMQDQLKKPRATLLLAQLYVKRGWEYLERARPLAQEALWLNPDEKAAHNAIFDSERVPCRDWNEDNRWQLIDFYKDFVKKHPDNWRAILWLLDLLCESGRTQEMKAYVEQLDQLHHTFRTDYYHGRMAKEEGNLPHAFVCWEHMVEEYPDDWCAWSLLADGYAYSCRYDDALRCYQKSMEIQEKPRYMDNPVAMAQIAEIQGDYEKAIQMREICIEMNRTDWNMTEGEWVDVHKREITRLRERMA